MKQTILIADSDIVLLELLRSRCEFLGLAVQVATRGDDAVRAIERLKPDVICVQQRLACSGGETVCDVLAHEKGSLRAPLIVLCDTQDEQASQVCRDLRAYVVPRSGNLWHRMEPLIYELTDVVFDAPLDEKTLVEEKTSAAPVSRPAQELRIDEPVVRRTKARGASRGAVASSARADARDSVLDAVFAWFGKVEQPSSAEAGARHDLHGPHSRDTSEPPWVLCIEDDYDFSMALKLRLEGHGVAVVRAFDGTTGYRTAFTHPASAILLDYNLPQGQGDYVLRRLKENPVTADIPVIVLTGNRNAATRRQMLGLGAAAYLTKPLDFSELVEVLGEYVDLLPVEYGELVGSEA